MSNSQCEQRANASNDWGQGADDWGDAADDWGDAADDWGEGADDLGEGADGFGTSTDDLAGGAGVTCAGDKLSDDKGSSAILPSNKDLKVNSEMIIFLPHII